ncbi:MlaD family protein [Mycobacterium sp. 663a-19]|nr:MlaD family protein [Mycobacterium sp. 663a-19]MEB3980103.1 MlaD family protein [Mycobacterium sp. 663a-19]
MIAKGALSFTAFVIMIVFAVGYFTSMGVSLMPPSERARMSMEVHDISGLVVGSSVQLRGVPIGEVTSISTSLSAATVNFYVDSRFRIPVDSDVRVENLSALGEAYIEFLPRSESGPILQDGQRFAAEAITQPPSISDLATTVVRVLNQFDPAALKRIIGEADAALPSPTAVLPNLSRAATLLRSTAATMHGKGRDLLDNFQVLLRNAQWVGPVLAFNTPWLTKMGNDFAALNDAAVVLHDRGAPQTLHNLSHLVGRLEHFLDHSGGDIKVLMQSMLPYLNDISGALMNFDTAQIFRNMLASVPEEGAVTLHVTIPDARAAENPPAGVPATPAAPGPTTPAINPPLPSAAPPTGDVPPTAVAPGPATQGAR